MKERKFLVVFGRGKLKKVGERIKVLNGFGSTEVPVRYIEALVCVGSVSVSSEAVSLLLGNNVPLFFMSRFGHVKGLLLPQYLSSKSSNRLKQYRAFLEKRLNISSLLVLAKVEEIERLYFLNLNLQKQRLKSIGSLEELMGVEGEASKKMFEKFRENISGCGLDFGGRAYRPPPDPVNALLSLAYTLTYSLAFPLVVLTGYDPYMSFLHSKRGSHASFCSDVIEPVRPFITKKLEEPLILGRFSQKDFMFSGNGCYLKKESYPKFLSWFESIKEQLVSYIKSSLLEVRRCME